MKKDNNTLTHVEPTEKEKTKRAIRLAETQVYLKGCRALLCDALFNVRHSAKNQRIKQYSCYFSVFLRTNNGAYSNMPLPKNSQNLI
jgi:hypothetical protein